MIYFVQEFDPVTGVSEQEMIEIYRKMAKGWEEAWKDNKLIGLFLRKWALGPKPVFMALWQLPEAASLDKWEGDIWEAVKDHMQAIEDKFWSSITNIRIRVMEKIDLLT